MYEGGKVRYWRLGRFDISLIILNRQRNDRSSSRLMMSKRVIPPRNAAMPVRRFRLIQPSCMMTSSAVLGGTADDGSGLTRFSVRVGVVGTKYRVTSSSRLLLPLPSSQTAVDMYVSVSSGDLRPTRARLRIGEPRLPLWPWASHDVGVVGSGGDDAETCEEDDAALGVVRDVKIGASRRALGGT